MLCARTSQELREGPGRKTGRGWTGAGVRSGRPGTSPPSPTGRVWAQKSGRSTEPTKLHWRSGGGSLALSWLLLPAPGEMLPPPEASGPGMAHGGRGGHAGGPCVAAPCRSLDWDRRPRGWLPAHCATHPHDSWGSEVSLSACRPAAQGGTGPQPARAPQSPAHPRAVQRLGPGAPVWLHVGALWGHRLGPHVPRHGTARKTRTRPESGCPDTQNSSSTQRKDPQCPSRPLPRRRRRGP